ncbi:hypothetical protein [Pedobacter nutrimenti]|uniref:DUF1440 domain-containing protein n=1 Tax=Pedobacter nutrimenti TaxID=1241337 RepID=A0A318UC57_9SPHI|nr:hypothetical protein [Pedobacter nutrimenti]PYF72822.1 hypothetical protein B0O44_105193 [Pedobacter nutrimenti]
MEKKTPSFSATILFNVLSLGLLVGSFDIATQLIKYFISTGKNPVIIFKYISSGISGPGAITDQGTNVILMGLLLHYGIAMSFTILFCLLYYRIKWMSAHKIPTGVIYALFIWSVMNLIVVPLSQTPKGPFNVLHALTELLILILMIGLPLSFLTGRIVPVKGH